MCGGYQVPITEKMDLVLICNIARASQIMDFKYQSIHSYTGTDAENGLNSTHNGLLKLEINTFAVLKK